jgi:hypothetical protein
MPTTGRIWETWPCENSASASKRPKSRLDWNKSEVVGRLILVLPSVASGFSCAKMLARREMLWHGLPPLRCEVGKKMTPQELERLGIVITGSTDWIAPLAKLLGFRQPDAVRKWWNGTAKITSPKQRLILLLAGQPETSLSPVSHHTRNRVARIMAMREQGRTYTFIGRKMGISRQAVEELITRYRCVKPLAEFAKLQCPVCSAMFQLKTRRQLYCSKHCGQVKRRSMHRHLPLVDFKLCLGCGTTFQPLKARAKYCSRRCRNNHYAKRYYRRRVRAKAGA